MIDGDLASTGRIIAIGPQARVVGEHAGLIKAHEFQRRGQVELDAVGLGVADVLVGVEVAGEVFRVQANLFDRQAGVDQSDQVGDASREHVDAEHAAATETALVADIQAPRGFEGKIGIADGHVFVRGRLQRIRGNDLIDAGTTHGARDAHADLIVLGQFPLQVRGGIEHELAAVGVAKDGFIQYAALGQVVAEILLGLGAFRAQAGFQGHRVAEHPLELGIGVQALFLVLEAAVVTGVLLFVVEVVVDDQAVVAILDLSGHAELHLHTVAQLARV